MTGIKRYWGYLLLAILAVVWWFGGVAPAILILLSVMTVAYFLFQAPGWCGADNRDGTLCRNNAHGLLMGCRLRHHKWQKLKMVFIPHAWRELNRGLWASPQDRVATVSALGGAASGIAAVIALFVT
ncbi:hypothetical protein [Actinoallomurus sp. CA-150999]|uniref:hypothetical protein n=1 Tax=Actinoallomurus sp. CA-150999 TaxID=3239887 RepID=UPI003D9246A0